MGEVTFRRVNGKPLQETIAGEKPTIQEIENVRAKYPDAVYDVPFGAWSNILEGNTLGMGDEMMGGVGGAYTALTGGDFGEGYERVRDDQRARLAYQRSANPGVSQFLELATPMAGLSILANTVKGAGLLNKAKKARETKGALRKYGEDAATFGGIGATYGFGTSEAKTPAEQASDAMYGGLLGAALPVVGKPLKFVAEKIGSAAKPIFSVLYDNLMDPKGVAVKKLKKALKEDRIDINTLAQKLEELGPDATIADLSMGLGIEAVNVRNLMRTLRLQDNDSLFEFTRKLGIRDQTAQFRLQDDVADMLGIPSIKGLDVNAAGKQIKAELAAQGPAYEEVMETTTIRMSDVIRRVLNKPAGQDALRNAKKNMDNEGIPGFNEQMELDGDILKMTETPTLRTLDQVKRSLDEQINQLMGGNITKTNRAEARRLIQIRKELVDELDKQSMVDGKSVYKEVRDNYAPGLEAQAALDKGKKAFGELTEDIAEELSGYGEAGKKAYRFGAARALLLKIDKRKGKNQAWSPTLDEENQIKIIFGKDADRMLKSLKREGTYNETKNKVLAGSNTADKLQDIQANSFMGGVRDAVGEALSPNMQQINPQLLSLLSQSPGNLQRALGPQKSMVNKSMLAAQRMFNPRTNQGLLVGGAAPTTSIVGGELDPTKQRYGR